MESLLENIKLMMNKQTSTLTESITKNIQESLEEKFKLILEENKILKLENEKLEKRVDFLENQHRKQNVLLFGLPEKNEQPIQLLERTKDIIKQDLDIVVKDLEIKDIRRLGPQTGNKIRPILISFNNNLKRMEILKNKKKFKNDLYIKEDFTKDVLEKRKQLQSKLREEIENGKHAYIKYDKIVTTPNLINKKRYF